MSFRHLLAIALASLLATSVTADLIPDNAHSVLSRKAAEDGKFTEGWACNDGYLRSGNTCVRECKSTPSKCFRSYIREKEYFLASDLYNNHRELFSTEKEMRRRGSQLDELADYLNSKFVAQMTDARIELSSIIFDPMDPLQWAQIESLISSARQLLSDYQSHTILGKQDYRKTSVS